MWIKNSNNKPDAMLTFATISFAVVTLNIFLATLGTLIVKDTTISFQHIDSGLMAAYLGSTFTAYVSRRWMDNKYVSDYTTQVSDVKSNESEEAYEEKPTEESPPITIGIR